MLPLLFLTIAIGAGLTPEIDPAQPYTAAKSNAMSCQVEFKAIVLAPQGTRRLQVWVPVPQDDRAQVITENEWSVFPTNTKPSFHTEEVFGNRFAYFEFANPQGGQIITHQFRAKVHQLDWDMQPAKVAQIDKWPVSFTPYRRAEQGIVIDDRFKKLAAELAVGANGPAAELAAVMEWTNKNLTYDHTATSLIASSDHALTKRRGDCSDYHGLCSSLGRALGMPTRVTYGLHLFPKNSPSHCKLEVYLPPYGWVSFDVSETQRLIKAIEASPDLKADEKATLAKAAVERLRRGFRDNTWLLHSKGTDYELAPKASQKVPLIATIYAEADGKPLPFPDPADRTKCEFAWITAHKYTADREVVYPFKDWRTLKDEPKR